MIDKATTSPEQAQTPGYPEHFHIDGREFAPVNQSELTAKTQREAAARHDAYVATAEPDKGTEVLRQKISLEGAIQRGKGLVMVREFMANSTQ